LSGSLRPCLFCGATGVKLTNEDVYPRWLRGSLGLQGEVTFKRSSDWTPIRSAPTLELRLREICAACNNGWMHDLETAFRSLMAPSLLGAPVVLNEADRSVVATWTMKTWVLLVRALKHIQGDIVLPEFYYRWFRDHRTPHPYLQVWLGIINALPEDLLTFVSTKVVGIPPQPPVGVLGVFTIGQVLFQVYVPMPSTPEIYGLGVVQPNAPLIPIWPDIVGDVAWPPEAGFVVEDLERLWPSGGFIQPVLRPPLI
jgi:hypothetical protein